MRNRFKRRLYKIQDIKFADGHLRYVTNDDGTLFAGPYRTKIKPEDLPEWYLYGRYYKRFGYMSTKGITDIMYFPSHFRNHFLMDDFLIVAYGGKIHEVDNPSGKLTMERYKGWDEIIWGNEIITILKGAKKYSGYDISSLIAQLKQKKDWLQATYPDEFGPDKWDIDVDKLFEEES